MRRPLEGTRAKIFVGFQEAKLFEIINMPLFCKRYVDYTFVIFYSRSESRRSYHIANQLHPTLKFSCEFEQNYKPFLDVLIEPTEFGVRLLDRIQVCHLIRKISLIKTLVHSALMICTKPNLPINWILFR